MTMAKRVGALVLCAALTVGTLLLSGCSTPAIALTVDGKDYEMGDYLAYMYNAYYTLYNQNYLSYYQQMGQDITQMTFPYEEEELKLEDYLKRVTVDTIVRQKAVENLMETYDLHPTEDEIKEFNESMQNLGDTLPLGFTTERFTNVMRDYSLNENALFYGLYDKGGKREVKDTAIREYFDDNYLSYKIIEVKMTDDDGKELSEKEQKEITDTLAGYLAQYNVTEDFDAVIEQYKEDTTEKSDTSDDTADDHTDEEEEETDENRVNTTVEDLDDEDMSKAIQKVAVGSAQVITYKAGGKDLTAALVLRMDPEKGVGAYVFEDEREAVIYDLKFEEFDKEVKEVIEELDVVENKRAIRMASIDSFMGE